MKKIVSLFLSIASAALICASASACGEYTGITLPQTSETFTAATEPTTPAPTMASTTNAGTHHSTLPTHITTAAVTTPSQRPPSPANIQKINYLDFRNDMNKWAETDENGNPKYTKFVDKDMTVIDGKYYYPFALLSGCEGLNYSFSEEGETLKLSVNSIEQKPHIAFRFSNTAVYKIGKESDSKIEFLKIRFKNNSSATKMTIWGSHASLGATRPDPRLGITLNIEPNSSEWQTITVSMYDAVKNNKYGGTYWEGMLGQGIAIYPFGCDDCSAYLGAEMEIDYVVIGSRDFVETYQSELERAGYLN